MTTSTSQFVSVTISRGVLTARFTGPSLGQREVPIVADELARHLAASAGRLRALVLDCSDVKMIPSIGLGLCVDLRNQAHRARAKTIVFGLNEQLTSLFKMMRVDRLCTMVDSADDLADAISA